MKKLSISLAILVVLVCLLLTSEDIVTQFGHHFDAITRVYFTYGLQAAVWLSGGNVIVRLLEVALWRQLAHRCQSKPPRIFQDLIAIAIYLIAASGVVATVLKQSITGIWATSGILSLIAGLALKDLILDMVSGLALQTEKPFEVGDWVEIQANRKENHVVAEVIQVNWRTTRLKSTSNNIIVIPNRRFCELTLTNFRAQDPVCRTEIELTFPLDECMDRVSDMLLLAVKETLDGVKLLESPEPEIRLGNRTLAGQSVEVRFFFSSLHISPDSARNVVMHSLLKTLRLKSLNTASATLLSTSASVA